MLKFISENFDNIKYLLVNFLIKLLWIVADDITISGDYFYRLYDNVPEHWRDEWVKDVTIYIYKKKNRKEIVKWLNEE